MNSCITQNAPSVGSVGAIVPLDQGHATEPLVLAAEVSRMMLHWEDAPQMSSQAVVRWNTRQRTGCT